MLKPTLLATLALSLPLSAQTPLNQAARVQAQEEGRLTNTQQDAVRAQALQQAQNFNPVAASLPHTSQARVGPCFDVEHITVQNATLITATDYQPTIDRYVGTCLYGADLKAMLNALTHLYISKGYVTSYVALTPQNLASGSLSLTAVEGTVGQLYIADRPQDRSRMLTAFPFISGKALNIRQIEQGLDQLNRLISVNSQMQIVPSATPKASDIAIHSSPSTYLTMPRRLRLNYNNSGVESSGEFKLGGSFEIDNLFGLNETFSISRNAYDKSDGGDKDTDALAGSFSIPFGPWTFGANASRSEYVTPIQGNTLNFQSSGLTKSYGGWFSRLLHRDQTSKTELKASITHKETESFIENIKLATGNRTLSIASLDLSHQRNLFGGLAYATLGYDRGMDWFHASKDAPRHQSDRFTPRAQFDRFRADFTWIRPFVFKERNWTYHTNLRGQYSPDPLYSSEKITLGDSYSVRGFKEDSQQGDSGVLWRNTLSTTIQNPMPGRLRTFFGDFEPYIALDAGYARARGGKDGQFGEGEGLITGGAIGLKGKGGVFSYDLTLARAFSAPDHVEHDHYEVYFNVSIPLNW